MKVEEIEGFVKGGLISKTKHPHLELWIHNYTPKCQYSGSWNETTLACRGLILDKHGGVVARPLKKFFNLEEHLQKGNAIPKESFEVYEKYDGSLGILYFDNVIPKLATRGSFSSEQAIKGTKILQKKFMNYPFNTDYTYLFEIIYPDNRIVVNYGEEEKIVLLAVINTESGEELSLENFKDFETALRYDGIKDVNQLKATQKENKEGYVIRFVSGLRLKVKFEEYVRLHRIMTQTSEKRVWEYLRDGEDIDKLLVDVPDEFFNWVSKTISGFKSTYSQLEEEAKLDFDELKGCDSRKDFAEKAQKKRTKSVLFKMLDNKEYSEVIWGMIKPEKEIPFKEEL